MVGDLISFLSIFDIEMPRLTSHKRLIDSNLFGDRLVIETSTI